MNALQLPPVGAAAPSAPQGKSPATAEAPSSPLKKAAPSNPEIVAPDSGADQQLAEARSQTAQAAGERKAQVEKTQAEKAKAAKEAAEARRRAEEEAVTLDIGTLDREIGLVEGTTKVFVDLVDPVHKKSVFRVFGPPEKSAEPAPAAAPTEAKNAYTRTGAPLPLKDLGVA
jgi:hypothetical protein